MLSLSPGPECPNIPCTSPQSPRTPVVKSLTRELLRLLSSHDLTAYRAKFEENRILDIEELRQWALTDLVTCLRLPAGQIDLRAHARARVGRCLRTWQLRLLIPVCMCAVLACLLFGASRVHV